MTQTVTTNKPVTQVQSQTQTQSKGQRIGILGGTFNPPHIGHLMIADQVFEQLDLDKILFIPDANPPHVDEKGAIAVEHRMEMVRRAIINHRDFDLCLIEAQRGGISYTFDTIRQLKKLHPENQYYFIIGGDMVEYLPKWHKIDELVQMVQFVGVCRKGYEQNSTYPIIWVNMPTTEVSSTWIRQTIQTHGSVRYFVPDLVQQYIDEKGLYLDDCND
ncbi:nicotinate-nucleotide adenylyltransferase [Bombilactobacillus folatiphilus]|uniref:Probable nicotinate-nucleotide adenylyltransferase n=1 Tax=Bombilactobacillus folatiphilus TaxID=2923362 RepID=A0ABY4PA89_9LACO|nr:nicotinate-nucleotide adenylyltransferase [Bombilactobacillus folatiphilus]UQS82544.1 nicotinate-nucleotide adenylyltransferase [Bombilactobacillus folatiphilus]